MGLVYGPGYSVCESFLIKVIEEVVDFEDLVMNDTNYKDMLMKYFQNKYSKAPKYIEISVDGPPNHRIFTMGVSDHHGKILGQGKESSKKKAEQMASREALVALGQLS
jgi:dsRNA-specific ribonuclease